MEFNSPLLVINENYKPSGDIQGLEWLTAGMDYQQDFSRSLLESSAGKTPKWNGEMILQAPG